MAIGERIKNAREKRDMTLEQVAKACKTTKQTIFKYENDIVTNIPYDKIVLLSEALNVSPSYFFGWEEKKEQSIVIDGLSFDNVSKEDIETIKAYLALPEERRKALAVILGIAE